MIPHSSNPPVKSARCGPLNFSRRRIEAPSDPTSYRAPPARFLWFSASFTPRVIARVLMRLLTLLDELFNH